MKTLPLSLILALSSPLLCAADSQTIDLGNGSTVEIKDGKVTVQSSSASTGPQDGQSSVTSSTSSSTSSRTDSSGNTVTTVTSERDGKRVTRTVTVSRDGKVSVTEPGQPDSAPGTEKAPAAPASGGWLGVHTVPVSDALRAQIDIPEDQGVLVEFAAPGGPAATAGLAAHDIILTMDGEPVKSVEGFRGKLAQSKPGQQVKLEFLRKGKPSSATATLGQRPPDAAPGGKVNSEAGRLLREMQTQGKPGRRGIVVDGDGTTRIVESDGGDAFDLLLNDPGVPETMKEQIRKSRELMKQSLPESTEKEE